MKVQIEIKEGDKVTIYSADTKKAEAVLKGVKATFEGFMKDTFNKETYTKITEDKK